MMSWPPCVPSATRSLYVELKRLTPVSADWLGSPDVVGGCEVGGDEVVAEGDGLVVPGWHAAITIAATPSRPTSRFRIYVPPTECVSPHFRSWCRMPVVHLARHPLRPRSHSAVALGVQVRLGGTLDCTVSVGSCAAGTMATRP